MNPEERKKIILDVSEQLFYKKGYDNTSTQEIIKKSKIARGTLYYYFPKKEDILDAVIKRSAEEVFTNAKKIAYDKTLPADKRLVSTLIAMSEDSKKNSLELEQVHSPQNALMHQKINDYILKNAGPFLTDIVKDGIEDKIFNTKYPDECVEMILIYANEGFDYLNHENDKEKMMRKFQAFFYNAHRLLGAKENSLDFIRILK
ncbi:MAG: TetR/AcrR family transcriptional regulator [Lagierella massiliensis]|nr:TetR/AcrR family transcriptional regulator [Lagierella massiliensis]